MTPNNEIRQVYTIDVESRFILTQTQIKQALGIGYKILNVEVAKDKSQLPIVNIDTAAMAILNTGYRALARANHPDLGGDPEIMKILNQTKKELSDLIRSLGE